MGLFDVKNITKRADRLLNYHLGLLENLGLHFERDGEFFYRYDQKSDDYQRIGYCKSKKMLSRTFNLEIKQVVKNIQFGDSFKIKLRFQGFKEISGARFVPEKGSDGYETFFNDAALLEFIWKRAKEVEVAFVKIEYLKKLNQLEIRVVPYAGAFLWVVVPPVFYDMKLKESELNKLMEISQAIKDHIDANIQ